MEFNNMAANNFRFDKIKNFPTDQHDVGISVGIGLMLILIVGTFIYFYTDTSLVENASTVIIKNSNISFQAHP
jgi:hypothetical protein